MAIINAASLTTFDVLTALNSAVAGDTVVLPPGTIHWASQVFWAAPANTIVLGAGTSAVGGGDQTIIIDDYASNSPIFQIETSASGTFRCSGITWKGGTGLIKENGIVNFGGNCALFRLDHCHIDKTTYSPANNGKLALFGGTLRGVVDHNIFDPGPNLGWLHIVNGYPVGHAAWAADTGFGTSDFLFFEDNQYNGVVNGVQYLGVMTDCHTGGKYVARYNTIVAAGVGQTHPTGHSGDDRGARAHEIYCNTITNPTLNTMTQEPNFAFDYNNSGPALVWGNTLSQIYKSIFYFNEIRKNADTYTQQATPNGWGYNGTEFNGTGSNWDGNTSVTLGYPGIDQPGRGKGDLLTGTFPTLTNAATGFGSTSSNAWPRQALEPVYEWSNTGSIVSGWGGGYVSNQAATRIVENRDYYLATTSFTGATGVGVGLFAARPVTCTPGVAYWATDQQTLYKATGTNSWSSYYTPYTYPHPLVSTSSTGSSSTGATSIIYPIEVLEEGWAGQLPALIDATWIRRTEFPFDPNAFQATTKVFYQECDVSNTSGTTQSIIYRDTVALTSVATLSVPTGTVATRLRNSTPIAWSTASSVYGIYASTASASFSLFTSRIICDLTAPTNLKITEPLVNYTEGTTALIVDQIDLLLAGVGVVAFTPWSGIFHRNDADHVASSRSWTLETLIGKSAFSVNIEFGLWNLTTNQAVAASVLTGYNPGQTAELAQKSWTSDPNWIDGHDYAWYWKELSPSLGTAKMYGARLATNLVGVTQVTTRARISKGTGSSVPVVNGTSRYLAQASTVSMASPVVTEASAYLVSGTLGRIDTIDAATADNGATGSTISAAQIAITSGTRLKLTSGTWSIQDGTRYIEADTPVGTGNIHIDWVLIPILWEGLVAPPLDCPPKATIDDICFTGNMQPICYTGTIECCE